MGTLSSDTLFHFTNSKEILINIIKNGFYPRYSIENYSFSDYNLSFAIPMVCFCDIPLSKTIEHSMEYGQFAIGMSKEWAMQKGVTPVFYIQQDSLILNKLQKAFDLSYTSFLEKFQKRLFLSKEEQVNLTEIVKDLNCVFHNTKPIIGISTKNGKEKKFYDEKEWRFYPDFDGDNYSYSQISINYVHFNEEKKRKTIELEKKALTFTLNDMDYIIVPSEMKKQEIITEIKNLFPEKIDFLISQKLQIITMEQIKKDF